MLPVIYLATILCFLCVVWAALAPHASSVRLSSAPGLIKSDPMAKTRTLQSVMLGLASRLVPARKNERAESTSNLLYAGSRITAAELQGARVVLAVGGGVASFMILRQTGQMSPPLVALGIGIGWVLPSLWLRSRIAKRKRAILRLLPEVLDLLSICIGAGVDFLGALNKVVLIKRGQREPLIEELSMALREIKLGKRRADALRDMAKRVHVPELSSFVRTLVQADRMGTPIAHVLAIHSEDVRLQRFIRAEREALKAPIKILVPLIFCIMPCVAIIVGAPIFLQFMNQSIFSR